MDTYKLTKQLITFHKNNKMLAREEELNELQLSTLIKINVDKKIDISYSFNEDGDYVYFCSHYSKGGIDKVEIEKEFKKENSPFETIIVGDDWIELLGQTKKENLTTKTLNTVIDYLLNSTLIRMIISKK